MLVLSFCLIQESTYTTVRHHQFAKVAHDFAVSTNSLNRVLAYRLVGLQMLL